jgi:hypothetical protein
MKHYLIKKTIIFNKTERVNYHGKCSISDNLERSWNYAFYDYNECCNKLDEIMYYDEPYYAKGFDFKYEIIEKEFNNYGN